MTTPSLDLLPEGSEAGLARAKRSVSPSALSVYEACPYQWRLRYVDGVGSGTLWQDANQLGTALHVLLAARLRGEQPPAEPALQRHREWAQLREIVEAIDLDREHLVEVETRFEVPVRIEREGRVLEAFVSGYRDALWVYPDRTGRVLDWKSGKRPPGDLDTWLQGWVYAWAAARQHDLQAVLLELVPLRPEVAPPRPLWLTREDLDTFEANLLARVGRLLADETWAPTPGEHCRLCPYVLRCPAGTRFLGEGEALVAGELVTPEGRQRAAKSWLALKATFERLDKALKEAVEQNGPIPLGDGMVLGWQSQHRSYRYRTVRVDEPSVVRRFGAYRGGE